MPDGMEQRVLFLRAALEDSEDNSLLGVSRHLNAARGQAVLTFMYLCVLGLCFLTAVVYFCRMQWEERYIRHLRETEVEGIRAAMAQSEMTQREESLAVQRKYIEERRARILQLFAPVRLTLEMDHFRATEEINESGEAFNSNSGGESTGLGSSVGRDTAPDTAAKMDLENTYGDEDSLVIELPQPGLHLSLGPNEKPPSRLVSGMCTICLCTFDVGSDVVWSSNEKCKHAFHEDCIEQWLMKQREGPLCPCCRRDFIVDPYDIEQQEAGTTAPPSRMDIIETPTNRVQALFFMAGRNAD